MYVKDYEACYGCLYVQVDSNLPPCVTCSENRELPLKKEEDCEVAEKG